MTPHTVDSENILTCEPRMMGESVRLSGGSIEQKEPESSLETYRFGVSMGALIVVSGRDTVAL